MPKRPATWNYSKSAKRAYKKRYAAKASRRRPVVRRTNMAKLIRSVALRSAETKHVHRSAENIQLYHNVVWAFTNVLYTTNGTGDENPDAASSYDSRIGDEIYLKGIDFRFWFSNKNDRPNTQYRVLIYKYKAGTTPSSTTIFGEYNVAAGVSNNKIIAYADTQNITILKQFKIASNGGDYSLEITAPPSYMVAREKSFERSAYVDMKMTKIKYSNTSTEPKLWDIGVAVVAYDAYGTLNSDNIASMAFTYKLYFKDP